MIDGLDPQYDYIPEDFGKTDDQVRENYPTADERREERVNFHDEIDSQTNKAVLTVQPIAWIKEDQRAYVITDADQEQTLSVRINRTVDARGANHKSHIIAVDDYSINSNGGVYHEGYLVGVWTDCELS